MRLPNVVPSVVLAVMFLGAGGFHNASQEPMQLYAATELKSGQNGHFVVTAQINGRSVKVLVDTGASAVALSYENAQDLGLHPSSLTFDVPVVTANGVTKAARAVSAFSRPRATIRPSASTGTAMVLTPPSEKTRRAVG